MTQNIRLRALASLALSVMVSVREDSEINNQIDHQVAISEDENAVEVIVFEVPHVLAS